MARTTSAAVQGIIKVTSGDDLTPFILVANELVTEKCASALDTDGNAFYDSTRLELIERWLSAHFYAVYKPRRASEKAGTASQTLRSKVDLGFDLTHYGQMAMRLDTAGGLAALDKASKLGGRVTVSATWIGLKTSEEPTDTN